jgi:hypothetical protein
MKFSVMLLMLLAIYEMLGILHLSYFFFFLRTIGVLSVTSVKTLSENNGSSISAYFALIGGASSIKKSGLFKKQLTLSLASGQ